MADDSRTPRPVAGSRPATSRPRRLAGTPSRQDAPPPEPPPKSPPKPPRGPKRSTGPRRGAGTPDGTGFLSRRRSTGILAAVLVVLVLLAAAMAWYRWAWPEPEPSADRPVVISEVRRAGALAAAQEHTLTILEKSHKTYEEQTRAALELIVDGSTFADEYRQTAEDVKEAFIEGKVELAYQVVGASVVRAGPEQVQALLFLNQTTTRNGKKPTVTPYRALVTVVPSGTGWRVLSIETK